jgi:caa(3)-type oxidase subunit IV
MNTHDETEFKRHIRTYVWVFVALLVATVITVAVSYFHFGAEDSHVGNVTVALIIAGFKAFLVGRFSCTCRQRSWRFTSCLGSRRRTVWG